MKNKTLQNCSISYHFLFNDQTFIDKQSSGFFSIYIKLIVTIFSNISKPFPLFFKFQFSGYNIRTCSPSDLLKL